MIVTKEQAFKLRSILETAAQSLADKEASIAPMFFPHLKADGTLVKGGTKINWKGQVKKAAVDLWDTEINNPDNAPSLWEDINYKDGYRIIPEVITATLVFDKDELGWWKGKLYRSIIRANSWTPEQNPSGWELVENV